MLFAPILIFAAASFLRPTQDPGIDTFRVEFLLGPSALLALIFNYKLWVMLLIFRDHILLATASILRINWASTPLEVMWSFSIFLESVAILPQLFMLQRTGEAETITTHYLFALGAYRALYVPNWIQRWAIHKENQNLGRLSDRATRYLTEATIDPIAVVAGLVQTALYAG
jgi:ER lumen protein retaining receptor